jgi:colanic acid/amylovoran biosynthesis glycosyltransferase
MGKVTAQLLGISLAVSRASGCRIQATELVVKVIGYVLADFPALSETFVGNEMRAMADRGHRVVPVIMHRLTGPAQPEDVRLADQATTLGMARMGHTIAAALRPGASATRALAFVARQKRLGRLSLLLNSLKIAAVARREGCTHLHAHFAGGAAAHAIVAARWIGATVSFIGHGHDVYSEPEDLAAKLASVDFVIGTCADMVGDFESIVPEVKAYRVPCGTDPDRFHAINANEDNGRFLLIGRLVEQKGIDDLLRALALLPENVTVDIVGDGPLRNDLLEITAELRLSPGRVNWLGARPQSWIAAEGRKYLALVAPFKMAPNGERDTGPVAIKEAMAMGLPVIGTRFMGIKEMISAETGLLVEAGDVEGLARAMQRMTSLTPEERRTMGTAGRHRVESDFTLQSQAQHLSAFVEAA